MGNGIQSQFLVYDFTYEGIRHRAKIRLEEDCHGVEMQYDDHDLEITWVKRIRHKGRYMTINIVVKDDWNDCATLGQVVASAWVCVYSLTDRRIVLEQFEPDTWSYIDDANPNNSVSKGTFYKT